MQPTSKSIPLAEAFELGEMLKHSDGFTYLTKCHLTGRICGCAIGGVILAVCTEEEIRHRMKTRMTLRMRKHRSHLCQPDAMVLIQSRYPWFTHEHEQNITNYYFAFALSHKRATLRTYLRRLDRIHGKKNDTMAEAETSRKVPQVPQVPQVRQVLQGGLVSIGV